MDRYVMFLISLGFGILHCQGNNVEKCPEDGLYEMCSEKKIICIEEPKTCLGHKNCSELAIISLSGDVVQFQLLANQNHNPRGIGFVGISLSRTDGNESGYLTIACTVQQKVKAIWSVKRELPSQTENTPEYVVGQKHSQGCGNLYCGFSLLHEFTEHGQHFNMKEKRYGIILRSGEFDGDAGVDLSSIVRHVSGYLDFGQSRPVGRSGGSESTTNLLLILVINLFAVMY